MGGDVPWVEAFHEWRRSMERLYGVIPLSRWLVPGLILTAATAALY